MCVCCGGVITQQAPESFYMSVALYLAFQGSGGEGGGEGGGEINTGNSHWVIQHYMAFEINIHNLSNLLFSCSTLNCSNSPFAHRNPPLCKQWAI